MQNQNKMDKLVLYLTFDHELPLGGVKTSFEKALFAPTERVMLLAEELKVPITLFSDVLCALRFAQWDKEDFYDPYIRQIQDVVKRGHDVQLHLHPHWLTSRYENGTFYPSGDFALGDFATKNYPDNIEGIIEKGVAFLNKHCRKAKPDYVCTAYRGGGFNLAPNTPEVLSALYKNGILTDSSIPKGYYFRSALSEVDYSHMPPQPNWFLGTDGNLQKDAGKGLFEIPVAAKPKGLFEMPTSFKMKHCAHRAPEDHGRQIHEGNPAGYVYKIRQLFSSRMIAFDNYTFSAENVINILHYNVKRYKRYPVVHLALIGHPKTMGNYSLGLMKSFVEEVRSKYGSLIEFSTFSSIAKDLKNK